MPGTAVFGILHNRSHVGGVVDSLRQEGFRSTDISLLLAPVANEGAVIPWGCGFMWPEGITALAFPGVGPLIGAGPIMNSFAMDGAEDCFVGGLVGKLAGIGIAGYHARRYERRIKSGDLLLSVQCSNHSGARRAKKLLERTGAEEIWTKI